MLVPMNGPALSVFSAAALLGVAVFALSASRRTRFAWIQTSSRAANGGNARRMHAPFDGASCRSATCRTQTACSHAPGAREFVSTLPSHPSELLAR